MKTWGATLIVVGLGSFILPMIGLQFRLLNLFGGSPVAGLIVAGAGGFLFFLGSKKEQASDSSPAGQPDRPAVSNPSPSSAARRCPNPQCSRAVAAGKNFCTACGTRMV